MAKTEHIGSKQLIQHDYLGHRERMRQRVLEKGAMSLTQQDIIEMLLMASAPRRDVKPQAKELLRLFGDIKGILKAPVKELQQVKGVKSSATGLLKIVDKICLTSLQPKKQDERRLLSHKDMIAYSYLYAPKTKNTMLILFLKANGVLIKTDTISTPIQSRLRNLVRDTIACQADQLIIAQYIQDPQIQITQWIGQTNQLYKLLYQLGIRLSDYILIDEERVYSLLRQKMIATQTIKNMIDKNPLFFQKETDLL